MRCSYNGLLYLTLNQKDPGSNPGRRTKQHGVVIQWKNIRLLTGLREFDSLQPYQSYQYRLRVRTVASQVANREFNSPC